ncbi:uncharacterized protein [Phyllobates terribilis]|uniref:uncharacterized protein n=1 Tax=Phyllobates terribilis TaxID=111132 RepID=UPI003CCB52C3
MGDEGSCRRRKPLVLASTKALLHSLLAPSNNLGGSDQLSFSDESASPLNFRAGILRFPAPDSLNSNLDNLDSSALVGLSTYALRQLGVISGSTVVVKNAFLKLQRVAQVVALDPPISKEKSNDAEDFSPHSLNPHIMRAFPSFILTQNSEAAMDKDVAYLSPILAFNIGLHTACFARLLGHGKYTLASLFEDKMEDISDEGTHDHVVNVMLEPYLDLPRFASHLRISFVNIPECGIIQSLKEKSEIENKLRQGSIDKALHEYFSIDRYLSTDDIFSVEIKSQCNSVICRRCKQGPKENTGEIIHFKVVAMDPAEEMVLRVNCVKTALVLGGSVASALPPPLLVTRPVDIVPPQVETVKTLATLIVPKLIPSVAKFKVVVLLNGLEGVGKRTVVRYVAHQLGLHLVEFDCRNLMDSSDKKSTVTALNQAFKSAQRYFPSILLLRHFDVLNNLAQPGQSGIAKEIEKVIRDNTDPFAGGGTREEKNSNRGYVYLIATTDKGKDLPVEMRRCFTHEMNIGPLTEEHRKRMISMVLHKIFQSSVQEDLEDLVQYLVARTFGFRPRDLVTLIAETLGSFMPDSKYQFEVSNDEDNGPRLIPLEMKEVKKVPQLTDRDELKSALTKTLKPLKKKVAASSVGTPEIPDVRWDDVGGLEDAKELIKDTIQLALQNKDSYTSGLRKRSGILLYGPPGTGKTLLAKAVATECNLNFMSVKGPELINMYIGESEKNVREVFEKGRTARPCVIFFDELDSLAPARGISGDSGGVMDRVVSQMLAEMDGVGNSNEDLFVIGASNRPDLIDPALLRPGRLDKLIYVGITSDPTNRERVLKALTRKFKLHEDVSLYSIAERCPPNFTGADLYALCADAWFTAAKRKVSSLGSSGDDDGEDGDNDVVIDYDDFMKVLEELAPSLSMEELEKYERLRRQFEGGFSYSVTLSLSLSHHFTVSHSLTSHTENP